MTIICEIRLKNDQEPKLEIVWRQDAATFDPYEVDAEATERLRANAEKARGQLRELSLAHKSGVPDRETVAKLVKNLARTGKTLYQRLFPDNRDAPPHIKEIRGWLETQQLEPAPTIEVLFYGDRSFFVPWNILYMGDPLKDSFASPTDNGYRGFWGVRYVLTGGKPADPLRRRPLPATSQALAVICPRVAEKVKWDFASLRKQYPDRLEIVHDMDRFEERMSEGLPEILYWLSHADSGTLKLDGQSCSIGELGDILEDGHSSLQDKRQFRGVAILNACSTGAPIDMTSYLEKFHRYNFSGILATEADVLDTFAAPYGETLLQHLLAGHMMGPATQALRSREASLPQSLLYGTYCPPTLRLDTPQGELRDSSQIQPSTSGILLGEGITTIESTSRLLKLPNQPYIPLAPVEAKDRALFAGRDADVDRFIELLADSATRVVLLHGASGVGKSSFIIAGVAPGLEEECLGLVSLAEPEQRAGTGSLFVRATDDPLRQIAQRLLQFCEVPFRYTTPTNKTVELDLNSRLQLLMGSQTSLTATTLRDWLGERAERLSLVLDALGERLPFSLVMFVDQTEEIFTLGRSPTHLENRRRFLAAVTTAQNKLRSAKLVLALRTEYHGRLLDAIRTVAEPKVLRDYLLTPLDEDAIREILVRPTLPSLPNVSESPREKYGFEFPEGAADAIAVEIAEKTPEGGGALLAQVIGLEYYRRMQAGLHEGLIDHTNVIETLDYHVDRQIQEIARTPKDRTAIWKLLDWLTLSQPDGTFVTAQAGIQTATDWWHRESVGSIPFDDLLPRLLSRRLVRVTLQGTGSEDLLISLGHDTLGQVAAKRRLDREKAEAKQAIRRRLRWGMYAAIAIVAAGLFVQGQVARFKNKERAEGLVTALLNAEIQQVPEIIKELKSYREWADPILEDELKRHSKDSDERLHISLAMLPDDDTQIDYLIARLLSAKPDQVEPICSLLNNHNNLLVERLWRVTEKPRQGEEKQLLQAASGLAVFDPDNEVKWKELSPQVTEALVNENPLRAAVWLKTLRPARPYLMEHLGVVYRGKCENCSQAQIDLATNILEDYASEDLDTLSELLLDAEPNQFLTLFDEFTTHGDEAIARLDQELHFKLTRKWDDRPLDPKWTAPPSSIERMMDNSNGVVEKRFAFCQTLPLRDLTHVATELGKSGYRPIGLRPYLHKGEVQVAATWTRDGRKWRMVIDQSASEIQQTDMKLRKEGFAAEDVAGFVGVKDSEPKELYAAIWIEQTKKSDDARFYAGITDVFLEDNKLQNDGFKVAHSMQEFLGLDGQQKYCSVKKYGFTEGPQWHSFWSTLVKNSEDFDCLGKIPWDINISQAPHHLSAIQRHKLTVSVMDERIQGRPNDFNAYFLRGQALYYLDQNEDALIDMNFLIKRFPRAAPPHRLRSVIFARLGKTDEAKRDLAKFQNLDSSESIKAYLNAIVLAHLGEETEGLNRLEAIIDSREPDFQLLYDAACAYSVCSSVFRDEKFKFQMFADRAATLLQQAVDSGYNDFKHIQQDGDLDPIRTHPKVAKIFQTDAQIPRYAGVWKETREWDSKKFHGLSPKEHLIESQTMMAKEYRAKSVSVASIDGELVIASVWRRPWIPSELKESVARRQANAAVAAYRMGRPDKVWPLLVHNRDPRLRTWIIHRFSQLEASPDFIVNRLAKESNASIRQALILSLGEFEEKVPSDQLSLSGLLLNLYRDDPDPGIHGAAEWVLRRWGLENEITQIDSALASGQAEGEREWYVARNGTTLAIIRNPIEFTMGVKGMTHLHRKRIGRNYALATKEVTERQYATFLREFFTNSGLEKSTTLPKTQIDWFSAVAYCRWLSEQEEIPEDQMCYPSLGEIHAGMKLPANYINRTGYRLPTAAEWEYACRCQTLTSRFYGSTDTLLAEYGWNFPNSLGRRSQVGSLKPNDFGLFDMYGNVQEWCQSRHREYDTLQTFFIDDKEYNAFASDTRILSGGSFMDLAPSVRSDRRNFSSPAISSDTSGFRIARTMP